MENGAANLGDNALGDPRNNKILDHIPRVEDSIVLQKVVFAGVAGNLEFTPHPDGAVESAALLDAFVDAFVVLLVVEGVVVETA